MAELAQLWNPRANRRLRRYWVAFEERIVIQGESAEQTGVLSLARLGPGALHAHLRVIGSEFEAIVVRGNDLSVWINGLELVIGISALEGERLLLSFGVARGSGVNVTLEAGTDEASQALALSGASAGADRPTEQGSSGLRQRLNA